MVIESLLKEERRDAMLKTELKIETVGKPDLNALPKSVQDAFLESLLDRISELYRESLPKQQ